LEERGVPREHRAVLFTKTCLDALVSLKIQSSLKKYRCLYCLSTGHRHM